jgi:tRNA (guanine37-N1)-methyltransferase
MKISILTLFPEMFVGPFDHSIIKRAQEKGLVTIEYINIRDFGYGKHKLVDDTPYGGGVGMVMRVDVVHRAIEYANQAFSQQFNNEAMKPLVVLMTASGKPFNQSLAKEFSNLDHLILICGHYEGIDDRIKEFIHMEVSIGDFVLTGGELPAALVVDAVTRLLPGAITAGATENESFSYTDNSQKLLEYPQYTKPPDYEGLQVPDVLVSGNHKNIAAWRHAMAKDKTAKVRPDLLSE